MILDTNIFVANLPQLKDLNSLYLSKIVFYVPWVVVQELDQLKSKKSDEKYVLIKQKAQEAIRFINSILESVKSNFFFENFSQVIFDFFILTYKLRLIFSLIFPLINMNLSIMMIEYSILFLEFQKIVILTFCYHSNYIILKKVRKCDLFWFQMMLI